MHECWLTCVCIAAAFELINTIIVGEVSIWQIGIT